MIVLIAPEKDIKDEITILNQLFEAGLEFYHLRKPEKNYIAHCDYLNQIDTKYHNRIIVHFFHELINEYDLKGIHFQEQKRRDCLDIPTDYFTGLNLFEKTISSSFHEVAELEKCNFEFDYYLLSPVFTSISKAGYKGRGFEVNNIDKIIIGVGGVTIENLSKLTNLGFKGVGVLGGVWNSPSPITNFKNMMNYFANNRNYR
jgi:thiamine-phosphate pyrophosphorylase